MSGGWSRLTRDPGGCALAVYTALGTMLILISLGLLILSRENITMFRDKGHGVGSKFSSDRCDGIGSPKWKCANDKRKEPRPGSKS